MEGGRAGRSSSRYGAASASTVFTGPVRKWNKKWIHLPPTNNPNPNNTKQPSNGGNNNNNNQQESHLVFYKWAPVSNNGNGNNNGSGSDDVDDEDEQPPRRKFKYIPVAVLEELNNEAAEAQNDEVKPMDTDQHAPAEPSSQSEKPDINDLPVEENQVSENSHVEKQDLNKSTSGLSLNLNACDGDDEESEEAKDQTNDDQ